MDIDTSKFLLEKVIATIDSNPKKRITFAEYMHLCLYDAEYGYYNYKNLKIGQEGADFFTSTSISSDFGELLAIQLQEFWQVLGKPESFFLLEMGAGEGTLALNILSFLSKHHPDFISNLEYIIIEKSTVLKAKQKELLLNNLPSHIKIKWSTLEDFADKSIVGCFFSNELVDALPVNLVTWQEQELKEIYLTNRNGNLKEVYDVLSTYKISNYFKHIHINFSELYPENYRTEVNLQALDWLQTVTNKLKKGFLLTIDYGYLADKYYHPQRFQGTLKCYYQHRHHDNPYVNLGRQDITSHVNFTALEKYGEFFGLTKVAYTQQALFLMNLGLGDRLNELSDSKMSLAEMLSKRNQLHSLINPQGLGNFKILLQSKNLDLSNHKFSLIGFKEYS